MTVRQIQHLLAYLGYYSEKVDGIWGEQSAAATAGFQQDYGNLQVDGIAGNLTQEALKQAVFEGVRDAGESDSFWEQIRYWNREEFRCRCGGKYCDGFPAEPDRTLVELLDDLRAEAGRPAHPSSGLRCSRWNTLQGGVSNSRHLRGKALDFYIEGLSGQQLLTMAQNDQRTRYAYIIEGSYVHVDVV